MYRSNLAPTVDSVVTRKDKGITGLETAIVLIAFVVVASVLAFTILSAGVFSSEANKQTIHAGLRETRTRLAQQGFCLRFRWSHSKHASGLQDRIHRIELTRW